MYHIIDIENENITFDLDEIRFRENKYLNSLLECSDFKKDNIRLHNVQILINYYAGVYDCEFIYNCSDEQYKELENLLSYYFLSFDTRIRLYYFAVQQNSNSLAYVPFEYRTETLCKIAVKNNGMALVYVTNPSYELCKIAVTQNGMALHNVPIATITKELCEIALQQTANSFVCIPSFLVTYEFFEIAFKNNERCMYNIHDYTCKDDRIYHLILSKYGGYLSNIPLNRQTYEMAKIAVTNYGQALKNVLFVYKTPEICKLAVCNDGFAIDYVLEKTNELCETAVSQNGCALQFIKEQCTQRMCEIAILNDGIALRYVPLKFKTRELCEIAVKNNGLAIRYVI